MTYSARICKFSDSDAMDVARDYFKLYAGYISEVSPSAEASVPDFGRFMKAWDSGDLLMQMLFSSGTPVGFQTAYKVHGGMLGQPHSYTFGACYMQPNHRTAYKVTLYAAKRMAETLKAAGAAHVSVALAPQRANRLRRLSVAAVTELSRGFAL
jgi:hypothetical protein